MYAHGKVCSVTENNDDDMAKEVMRWTSQKPKMFRDTDALGNLMMGGSFQGCYSRPLFLLCLSRSCNF